MANFDNEQILELLEKASIGWWEADFKKQQYKCSDIIIKKLGLNEKGIISFDNFHQLIPQEYLTQTVNEFYFGKTQNIYDHIYPLQTCQGIQWVRSKLCSHKTDTNGNIKNSGFLEFLNTPFDSMPQQTAEQRINNLFCHQNSISRSLFALLKTDDITTTINNILSEILREYPKGRIYIAEYNNTDHTYICRYQAHDKNFKFSHPMKRSMPIFPWWWQRIVTFSTPIILSNLNELPEEATEVYKYLDAQGIKSTLIVPMYSRDGVWGCAGIDITDKQHIWKNEDYQWFSSITNIISICLELHRSEENALSEKQYLANLYKHMPIGYLRLKIIYNDENQIIDYLLIDGNDTFFSIFETNPNTIGKKISEINFEYHHMLSDFTEIINSGKALERDYYLKKQQKYCKCNCFSPQKDELICLLTDITETYATHQALDHRERLLRNIYHNLPAGIELYDKDGYLIDINDREIEIFGLTNKETILGLNIFDNPIMPEGIKEKLKKSGHADFTLHYDFDKLNGYYKTNKKGTINIQTKGTALHDAQNRRTNYLLINIDRTETTIAYNKIEEFKDFFSLIGKFAKVGYAHFNALTCEGYALSSWYHNIGEEEGTPLSQIINIYNHLHPDDSQALLQSMNSIIQGKIKKLRQEVRVLSPDGQIGWTQMNMIVRNYSPEQHIIEMLCINYDLTELKNTEAKLIQAKEHAEESDRLKSAFIANMSHEIRTPLNAIVGFSNILAETDDPDERAEYQAIVEKNNELLLQLISDILDLSKIEAGILEIVRQPIDINELCRNTIKTLKDKTPQNVELLFKPEKKECHILSDHKRIQQVLNNFINNAQKFTSQGHIILSYECQGDYIKFYVQDTGMGISQENQPHVFERFVKFNNFIQGTGLGLSICHSIVQQLEGEIGLDSQEGKGSCFWFRIPTNQ